MNSKLPIRGKNIPSYVKYFFSYLLIVTVLIIGAYCIIRNQLSKEYLSQRIEFSKSQLDNLAEQLREDILYLSYIDSQFISNRQLRQLRYTHTSVDRYYIYDELKKYDNSSKQIISIIYKHKNDDDVITTTTPATWKDNSFVIMDTSGNTIVFDPAPYLDNSHGRIMQLADQNQHYVIYFPPIRSSSSYIFFYILDTADILMQIKNVITNEMPAIALVDSNKQSILGVNTDLFYPYINNLQLESGLYKCDSEFSLYVSQEINNGFRMVSIIQNQLLIKEITAAFADTYLMLIALGIFGLFLISVSMRFTYFPLRNVIHKIPSDSSEEKKSNNFENVISKMIQNHQITNRKLEDYRISMQKSLLDSFLDSKSSTESLLIPDIDAFFEDIQNKKIYIIFTEIHDVNSMFSFSHFLAKFSELEVICKLLEKKQKNLIFLIRLIDHNDENELKLKELLQLYYDQTGCMSAISRFSDSPIDIPLLYESAKQASRFWPDHPVADAATLPSLEDNFIYPQDKLNSFSSFLNENNFPAARSESWQLLQIMDEHQQNNRKLQNYFIPCILIDMLTIIINHMNISNIDFHHYGNVYYETLYFCRSFSYSEKSAEITENIGSLLDIIEQETAEKLINSAPFKKAIEEHYCDPDFSIVILAKQFQLSVSYMSYQFKKEMNMKFSDYLWMLRLNKAKELLTQTNIPVDAVSISVGYYSSSSFRRKFKSETGLSPSQYRAHYSLDSSNNV